MAVPSDIDQEEEDLRRRAADDLPALAVAGQAGDFLASIIARAPVPPAYRDSSSQELQHQAIWLMGAQAFRVLRAAMNTIVIGYDDQAVGKVRLIFELHARAEKAFRDKSGQYARQWLSGGSAGSGASLVGQEFWEMLSGPPHATIRGTLDWTAISEEDGRTRIVLGPERRPELSNSTLTSIASNVRDIGHMLEVLTGLSGDSLEALDESIETFGRLYLADDPDAPAVE
jgi:hypothetical protein